MFVMSNGNDSLVVAKGFYTSTKGSIMEKHGNLYGNFAVSLDYVLETGINKNIMTFRTFYTKLNLETLLDKLFDTYGNYHLNYLLMFPSNFFDDDDSDCRKLYNTEINKFIMQFNNGVIPEHIYFNKNMLYQEFCTLKQIIKSKKFAKQTWRALFVNSNIYSIYMYTGMNLI